MVYIPPGPITGVLGLPGTGKTFIALVAGFEMAEELHLDVVSNFPLNAKALYYYFLLNGYTWLLSRLIHGKIQVRSCASGSELALSNFMQEKGTLYLIDEAGVYLNSRNFKNIPLDFLSDLAQIRHDCRRLFWIAQYRDQVDKTLRELTASYIVADCPTRYSRKLSNTELVGKYYRIFTAKNYDVYEKKIVSGSVTGIKATVTSMKLAEKTIVGGLTDVDRLLFKAYGSFLRVEAKPELINPFCHWEKTTKYIKGDKPNTKSRESEQSESKVLTVDNLWS
ncbi:MAG TPA: hypothetical protein DD379_09620 [Cyanobacteria bacterium UBA11162]|nr:hypothetical protein [Cyanobacteria bacterium UBA11162]